MVDAARLADELRANVGWLRMVGSAGLADELRGEQVVGSFE